MADFIQQATPSRPIPREVSKDRYDHLLHDTAHHPRFEGMSEEQRKVWMDARISVSDTETSK